MKKAQNRSLPIQQEQNKPRLPVRRGFPLVIGRDDLLFNRRSSLFFNSSLDGGGGRSMFIGDTCRTKVAPWQAATDKRNVIIYIPFLPEAVTLFQIFEDILHFRHHIVTAFFCIFHHHRHKQILILGIPGHKPSIHRSLFIRGFLQFR